LQKKFSLRGNSKGIAGQSSAQIKAWRSLKGERRDVQSDLPKSRTPVPRV